MTLLRAGGLLAVVLMVGCGTSFQAIDGQPVLVASPRDPGEMRAAVVRALDVRRFVAEAEQPGSIVARHERRGVSMRVQIDYSATSYTVRYLGSEGVETQLDPQTGAAMIDRRYARMIDRLETTIGDEIERPERERAEAIARQQQYELQVAAEQRRQAEMQAQAEQLRLQQQQQAAVQYANPVVVMPVPSGVLPQPGSGGGVVYSHHEQHRTSEQSYTCCINGARYECPGQAAFEQCMTLSPSACSHVGGC